MKAVTGAVTHRTDNVKSPGGIKEHVHRGFLLDIIERLETSLSSSLLDRLRKATRA